MTFCLCLAVPAGGAGIGSEGYTNDFSSLPVAADFATSATGIAGASGDIGSAEALDAYVQNVAASSITTALVNSSPTNPPVKLKSAQWTSGGTGYILTRATGNRATVILARLVNETGADCNTLHLSYQLTVAAPATEQVPGQRIYYSFSAASNAWTSLPAISGLNASQLVSTHVLLKETWSGGGTLYLLWADDNSTSSTETAYEIDNFFASASYVEVPLAITLTAPPDGEHVAFGQTVSASVALTGSPTNVSYYLDDALAVERLAPPFSPVDLPALSLGAHTLYVTARDASNHVATTLTNTFVVDESLSGEIGTNTTLYASNSPYTASGNLTVASNVTLTLEPGVTLRLRNNCGITVHGSLVALGNPQQPIAFTRYPGDANWERILFVEAADSAFRHCVFEYANSVGDHQDYYPTDCSVPTNATRVYHEAVVILASHVDFDYCSFTNLPDASASAAGDAIAVIADDYHHPGPASANVRHCTFIGIGQGVHTRYAHVWVEQCTFKDKRGDNDDVDLYGESDPPCEIRNNLFLWPTHEDRINPTRCSPVIDGNIIHGSSDHGIVLRDVGHPIVCNNVLYNCSSGGISVQNGCEALIVNNTLVNCNRAIKLFDHLDRINPPYCLTAASGSATLYNNIIWNSTPAFDLSGNSFGTLSVHVAYSDIQGGIANASVKASAVLTAGEGNINADPLFASAATTNFHILAGSPCIDAGTNQTATGTDLALHAAADLDGVARPLDSDGDGQTRFDMGAFEILVPTADSNGDGIPDGWCQRYGLNPASPTVADEDPDQDGQNNLQEYLADTDPTNPDSYVHVLGIRDASRDRMVTWTNAFNPGVLSVLTATNVDGPWQPRENHFTTNALGQARITLEPDTTFCRLLAVDISTNTPLHFSNVVYSYGVLETVAGLGLSKVDVSQWKPEYEGAWATNVCLSRPHISFGDSRGNVLIVDQRSSSVLKVTPEGRLYTYAGTHVAGNNGDGPALATTLHLNDPNSGWLGTNDTLYVLDTDNGKVRRIGTNGIMSTMFTTAPMGDGRALWVRSDESEVYFGSGATSTTINKWTPTGGVSVYRAGFGELGNIAGDEQTGALYVSDRAANRVYRLDTNGVLTAIAGNGTQSNLPGGGDGGSALLTGLIYPRSVAFLPNGGFFTSEHSPGNRIWYIDPEGIIHLWMRGDDVNNQRVGDGEWFYEDIGDPAVNKVSRVRAVIPDPFGNLIITESNYGYVRRIRFQRMIP